MSDKVRLERFMEEMVSVLENRLSSHEKAIEALEKEISILRKAGGLKVDKSVLRVLRGE